MFLHAVLALGLFVLVDYGNCYTDYQSGTIVDKHYKPAYSYNTVSVTHTGKTSYTRIIHHYVPEQFLLFVGTPEGIRRLSVSSGTYQAKRIQQPAQLKLYKGYYSHHCYRTKLLN